MSGLTGLICLLYQTKSIDSSEKTDLMILCGKRLLELSKISNGLMSWKYVDGSKYTSQQKMELGGYSHGSSSICVAFYMLYLATKDLSYKNAFLMALNHDRSLFSNDIGGWIDGRDMARKIDNGSWCHGSAGIALSRIQLLSLGYNDSLITDELNFAILNIQKRLSCNFSICHGVMGNLEILHILENLGFKLDIDISLYENRIKKIIANNQPLWCGDDNNDSLIGLFMGISGIGYQFLRIFFWETVPSILCMETNTDNTLMHSKYISMFGNI